MHRIYQTLAVGLALAAVGCGASVDDSALGEEEASATPEHWRGIQSCKGEAGAEDILSSDETEIDDYVPSKTRVELNGVRVGPSSKYSCGPLDFEAVVTSTSVATYFESPKKHNCTSPTGRSLVVSELDGYDLDQRSAAAAGGRWNLKFDLRIEDEPVDAGAAEQARADITCHFELTLQ